MSNLPRDHNLIFRAETEKTAANAHRVGNAVCTYGALLDLYEREVKKGGPKVSDLEHEVRVAARALELVLVNATGNIWSQARVACGEPPCVRCGQPEKAYIHDMPSKPAHHLFQAKVVDIIPTV